MAKLQKITTNLWFDTEAEEAASFYTSILLSWNGLPFAPAAEPGGRNDLS